MTGFGRSENHNAEFSCKVEIRSVNSRFIEIHTRLPKPLSGLEPKIKSLIKKRCSRGSFDVSVTVEKENGTGADLALKANLPLATQYVEAMNQIKNELGLTGEVEINTLLSLRDVIKFQPLEPDSSQEEMILETTAGALGSLINMRTEEGQNLHRDIQERIEGIKNLGGSIRERYPEVLQEFQEKLREKINTLTEGVEPDESRLAQEVAIMADRCDVTEEVIRMQSHLQQFGKLLESEEPQGRKLEFITQEINRETNTIGSKTNDYQVSQWVIEIKSTLEKVREQLQNIE